jgi:hypothetical protein
MHPTTSSASSTRRNLLQQIEIAAPCNASWDDMDGNEQMRFCNQCSLHVYNLSAMTAAAAEELILSREGKLCVRLYRRADGTVLTEDCPKGLEKLRRRMKIMAGAVAAALLGVFGGEISQRNSTCAVPNTGGGFRGAVRSVLTPVVNATPRPLMGDPAPPPMMGAAVPLMGEPEPFLGQAVAPPVKMGRMAPVSKAPTRSTPPRNVEMGDVLVK